MTIQGGVKSSTSLMQEAIKTAYNVEVSEHEANTITTRLISLIKLLDQMNKEQNEGVAI